MTKEYDKTARIRHLNDLARTDASRANATWMLTSGITHLLLGDLEPGDPVHPDALARVTALRRAIAEFADWSEGNDPYGEHDFGAFELFGERMFFKVNYYHPQRDVHAPDPANIELCRRVLTVMLADEY